MLLFLQVLCCCAFLYSLDVSSRDEVCSWCRYLCNLYGLVEVFTLCLVLVGCFSLHGVVFGLFDSSVE